MASSKKPKIQWGDDASKLIGIIRKAILAGGKNADQGSRVASKAAKQMTKQGKKAMAADVRTAKKGAAATRAMLVKDAARAEAAAAGKKVMSAQERTLRATRLGEAVGTKGTKLVRGKEMALGEKKASDAISQGVRASSQRAKGNAKLRAVQETLRREAKAAKGAERVAKMRKLRAHETKHGRFS